MTLNVNVNMVDIATVPIGLPKDNGRKLAVRALNCSRPIAADINYDFMKVGTDASFPRWEDCYSIGVRFNDEIADILVDGKNYQSRAEATKPTYFTFPVVNRSISGHRGTRRKFSYNEASCAKSRTSLRFLRLAIWAVPHSM
jgi:hypothetical protein